MYLDRSPKDTKTEQYGKDYCAVAAEFIVSEVSNVEEYAAWTPPPNKKSHSIKNSGSNPPFWMELNRWMQEHREQACFSALSTSFSKFLVRRGIYEGETIMFPFVAGKDKCMVQWLLKDNEADG